MGNCMDNKPQTIIQDDGSKPEPNHGQYRQNQQNGQSNEEYGADYQQSRYQDYNYKSGNQGNDHYFSQSQYGHPGTGGQKNKIDFDNIGSDFLFYDDIKRMNDRSPWQRDENDNSNRPNEIQFADNSRQPKPNGLATRGQSQVTNQSMYGTAAVLSNNLSMNRSADLGYAQSVLLTNRKKQNIFYDASTYNQNPYVKSIKEGPPQRQQALQSPYINFSTVSYQQ